MIKTIWSKIAGFVRAVILPDFVLGHEKALAAFVTPILVGAIATQAGMHVAPGVVEQLMLSLISGIAVHQTANT